MVVCFAVGPVIVIESGADLGDAVGNGLLLFSEVHVHPDQPGPPSHLFINYIILQYLRTEHDAIIPGASVGR